jgi:hypothetical protein
MVNEIILCTLYRLKTLTITEKAKSFKETTPANIPGLGTLTNFLQHDNIYSSFGILNLDSFALTRQPLAVYQDIQKNSSDTYICLCKP